MIFGIDHINIVVGNLQQSEHFYTELLGFTVTRRAVLEGAWIESIVGFEGVCADVVYVQPPGEGPRIELLQYRAPAGAAVEANALANTVGLRHMAFRVDNIHKMYERFRAAGVEFIGPPQTVPAGVVRHDAGRKTLCYLRDPDGVILELAEYCQEEM